MLERNRAEHKPHLDSSENRSSEELSLSDVATFVDHYWPLIAATMFFCSLLGLLYIITATPTYTAVSQLLIEANQPSSTTIITSESSVAPDTPQIESEIAVLTSEQILQKASQRVDQAKNGASDSAAAAPKAAQNETHGWLHDFIWGTPAPPASKDVQEARLRAEVKAIQANLDVKRIGLSYVLELSYRDPNPAAAAQVVNAIGDSYVQDKIDARIQNARQGSMWLEARIEEIRHLMNEAALDVQEFKARRDYRLADRPEGSESPLEPPLPGVQPRNDGAAPPANNAPTAPGAKPSPELPTLEELDSRAQTYRKIYESYLQAYTDTVQRQSYPATSARVITRAEAPERASSPKKLLTLIASLVLGGFLGLGISLVHMSFDKTVRSSRQIWRNVGAPLLGQIGQPPHADRLPPWLMDIWAYILGRPQASKASLRVVQNRPQSRTSRELAATALALQNVAEDREAQIIGFLDAGDGGNSAAVASNLALLYARAGKRTLLVEIQTGKKNLASDLKLTLDRGLEDVIDGGVAVEKVIEPSAHEPTLSLLMARGTGGAEFWTEGRIAKLRDVLGHLRDRFDSIFVHLPPATQSDHSSKAVDAVVIVTKLWTTKMPELAMATTRLHIADKPVLGVIIAGIA